jgi:hypothetical protein
MERFFSFSFLDFFFFLFKKGPLKLTVCSRRRIEDPQGWLASRPQPDWVMAQGGKTSCDF